MGQYWYPVNLDKKEFVHPHRLGCGLKLGEQLGSLPGTGSALIVLCAAHPRARGGGDLRPEHDDIAKSTIGRWAGDRIAIVGDYAEESDLPEEHHASKIYSLCSHGEEGWTDVSDDVCHVLEQELGGTFKGDGWRDFVRQA